jgi:hypothetical protein
MLRVRIIAWSFLIGLAGLQAWAGRFALSPDGVAYLDLADSFRKEFVWHLANAYWSPAYPAVIAALRTVFWPTRYWETPLLHLANFLLFLVCLGAFEYFLVGLARAGRSWARDTLATARGRAMAYAFFGLLTLVMTPLTLTTPDMLVSAIVYVVLGALLRLHSTGGRWGAAAVLGLALAAGAVAKSFMIPWAVVVLLVAWRVAASRGVARVVVLSTVLWATAAGLWTVTVSRHADRVTFGDTGALTYAWYVNGELSPSAGEMPPAARDPSIERIIPGAGVFRAAVGTIPLWYDPARWYAGVKPHFDARQQWMALRYRTAELAVAIGPLLFLLSMLLATSDRVALRSVLARTWPVVLPALVAIGAYAMIFVATRYVVAFIVAATMIVWVSTEWSSRITPRAVTFALGIPFLLMVSVPSSRLIVMTETAIVLMVLAAFVARGFSGGWRMVFVLFAGWATYLILHEQPFDLVVLAFLAVGLTASVVVSRADRFGYGPVFAATMRRWLPLLTAVVLAFVGARKYVSSLAPIYDPPEGDPNQTWVVAQRLKAQGVEPLTRTLVVGSPFEAYWARTILAQVVGVVPPSRVAAFWALSEPARDSVIKIMSDAAGIRAVVVTMVPDSLARDPAWRALYPNGVRMLR